MKVLIADKFDSTGVDELSALGCEITIDATLQGDALRDAVERVNPRLMIVRGTKVTGEMLEASEALAVVVRAGAGVNSIDVATASRRSILVANCPGKNAVAVAELTLGLILSLDRRIVDGTIDLRRGVWDKKTYTAARGLKGRTLGVLGMGPIGQAVVRRAMAFDMNVVAWSRSLTDETAEALGVERCENPGEVAARCDVLTIHLAATPETKNLVDADVLDQLKPGSYVINTARAEVMDYEALRRGIAKRGLRVGLDVFPGEPSTGSASFEDPTASADGIVYGTHHIGASTEQAQHAIASETVEIVGEYLRNGRVRNCVNLRAKSAAKCVVVVRHKNRPGVLAHTLHKIRHAGVNVEEMENVICEGAESACAQIKLDGPVDAAVLAEIKNQNEHIFAVSMASIDDV